MEALEPVERNALTFAMAYEKIRRELGQFGYRVFPEISPVVLELSSFKTSRTVVKWLEHTGWKISWTEVHWQGYIKFAFRQMAPTVPQLGQLRNGMLLRRYLASAPDAAEWEPPKRPREDLERIYRACLDPLLATTPVLAALGLRPRFEDTDPED